MASVIDGVTLGKDECKRLFKNKRWNCADINQGATALGHMRKAGKLTYLSPLYNAFKYIV